MQDRKRKELTADDLERLTDHALKDLEAARKLIAEEGYIIDSNANTKTLHPAVKLQRDAFDRLAKLSRLRAELGQDNSADPLDKFRSAMAL